MRQTKRFIYSYLFCFLLLVAVELLSSGGMPSERIHLVLMPLLALLIFLFGDYSQEKFISRIKSCRWAIVVLVIGIVISLFVGNTLFAGGVILASSFTAPLLRTRKNVDWN